MEYYIQSGDFLGHNQQFLLVALFLDIIGFHVQDM